MSTGLHEGINVKSRATVERCDNPDCDYEQIIADEGAVGYHFGKGFWVQAGGGPIPAFYAHQEACIVPAMHAVIEKAWG